MLADIFGARRIAAVEGNGRRRPGTFTLAAHAHPQGNRTCPTVMPVCTEGTCLLESHSWLMVASVQLPPFLFFYFVLASFSGQYLGSTVAVTYHSYLGLVCNAEIVFGYHPQHTDPHSHVAKSYRARVRQTLECFAQRGCTSTFCRQFTQFFGPKSDTGAAPASKRLNHLRNHPSWQWRRAGGWHRWSVYCAEQAAAG